MELLLPLTCFISGWYLTWVGLGFTSIRQSFLIALLGLGAFVVFSTEMLSIFKMLHYQGILFGWILLATLLFIVLYLIKGPLNSPQINIQIFPKTILTGLVIIISIIGLTAIQSTPNTPDALIYHLPRVEHWMQNNSLGHFPTYVQRQLYMPPFTEVTFLHLKILTGNDTYINCIQWIGMIASAIGASLIAKTFGCTQKQQLFTTALVFTIPVVILQASGPKNDVVLGCWLVTLVYFVFEVLKSPNSSFNHVIVGVSTGLAILTKGTAFVYVLPPLIFYTIIILKKLKLEAWKPLLLLALLPSIINAGHLSRNFKLYESPIVAEKNKIEKPYLNEELSPDIFASNLIKNMALQWGLPSTDFNKYLEDKIVTFHELIGLSINNQKSTYLGLDFRIPFSNNEDTAGNPIHFLLIISSFIIFISKKI